MEDEETALAMAMKPFLQKAVSKSIGPWSLPTPDATAGLDDIIPHTELISAVLQTIPDKRTPVRLIARGLCICDEHLVGCISRKCLPRERADHMLGLARKISDMISIIRANKRKNPSKPALELLLVVGLCF